MLRFLDQDGDIYLKKRNKQLIIKFNGGCASNIYKNSITYADEFKTANLMLISSEAASSARSLT